MGGFSANLIIEQVSQVSSECFLSFFYLLVLFQLLMKLFNSTRFLDNLGFFFVSLS